MICSCGAETTRGTVIFGVKGEIAVQHCKVCRPELYEGPRRDPSDMKIWIGPEYMPNRYVKTSDADGPIYMATDELQQDTLDAVSKKPEEALRSEQLEQELADKKRATRRTAPMSEDEMRRAVTQAKQIAKAIEEYHATIQ